MKDATAPEDKKVAISLSQVQIIRSLAEALAWFEKELAWNVEPAELRHLTGRIGELYAAMITRGQMALAVNQKGYDVVSAEGEHISVKTVTSSNHVQFRKSTMSEVDRVLILRIDVDEGEASIVEVFDGSNADLVARCKDIGSEYRFIFKKAPAAKRTLDDLKVTASAQHENRTIIQLENGTIVVESGGVKQPVAKPILREICEKLGISLLNSNGNRRNTRQLGAEIIATLGG